MHEPWVARSVFVESVKYALGKNANSRGPTTNYPCYKYLSKIKCEPHTVKCQGVGVRVANFFGFGKLSRKGNICIFILSVSRDLSSVFCVIVTFPD